MSSSSPSASSPSSSRSITTTLSINQSGNTTPPSTTSGYANTFTMKLSKPAVFRNAEVALVNLNCYYSWFNITAAYGNNQLAYQLSGQPMKVLTLPDGVYTIDDINNFMHLDMYNNNYYMLDQNNQPFYFLSLAANPAYYCVTLTSIPISSASMTAYNLTNPKSLSLTGYAPQLVFFFTPDSVAAGSTTRSMSSMARVLGFATSSSAMTYYPPSSTYALNYQVNGTYVPQITLIDNVNLLCSLVSNNYIASAAASLIHSFSPTVTSGQQIVSSPPNLVFYPIMDGVYSEITMRLVDNSFIPLQILDPAVNMVVVIRHTV